MSIYQNISELVGNTPLLQLNGYIHQYSLNSIIYGKLESANPAGSVKDRIAKAILLDAIQTGKITKDSIIIEPTSGNTGIGLASLTAALGLQLVIVMPDNMSDERKKLLRAYGVQLVLTAGALGMEGAIAKARDLAANTPLSFMPSQFENLLNPKAHFQTTGPEIYSDTNGEIDYFVAGVGTGGTISGVGKYLKEKNPAIKIIAVEPSKSPFLSKGIKGNHKIQGIGSGFAPKTLDTSIYDEIICVDDLDAFKTVRDLAQKDGILVGISSGAAVYAAKVLSQRNENINKKIVVMLPDTGERYLSTQAFLR